MKNLCISCSNRAIDDYGYVCDLYCGKHSEWLNYQAGIKEVMEWIETHNLIKPDEDSITQFSPFYQIEQKELKKWGETKS